jgi:hypothetical protein
MRYRVLAERTQTRPSAEAACKPAHLQTYSRRPGLRFEDLEDQAAPVDADPGRSGHRLPELREVATAGRGSVAVADVTAGRLA